VFRTPEDPTHLAVVTGIGAQLIFALMIALVELAIFVAIPSTRPIVFYVTIGVLGVCGFLNGYITSRTMKFFNVHDWKKAALTSAMIFPCYLLFTLSAGDIVESIVGSAAAVPLSEGLWHYLLWWAIDAPCAAFGAYKGFLTPLSIEPEVSPIKRSIPEMPWYLKRYAIAGLYGPIIFATIGYEFNYLMDSIWRSYMIYAMFGILILSLAMMVVTIASLSIVVTYKLLCHQNYDWWWSSFNLGASGGVYMLIYSVFWMIAYEDIGFLGSDFVYWITMVLVSGCFGVMCGSISLLSSYLFVESIYLQSSRGQFTKF